MIMKKIYNTPQTEVLRFNTTLMSITHEASVLPGPGSNNAPATPTKKTEVF